MSTPAGADTPEALHAVIADAFNRRDLHTYAAAYDEDATLVVPPDGLSVHGRDNIRTAAAPMFARRPQMRMVVAKKVEADGLALTHGQWALALFDADGTRTELNGRGTMVSRRRSDGTWGIVLDDPLGPE